MALIAFPIWIVLALVLLFVGSGLLRAATGLANKTLGPARRDEPIGWDWDADEEDEDLLANEGSAIPEPGIGQGMRILFLAGIGNLFLAIVLQYILWIELRIHDGVRSFPGIFLLLVFGFLILSAFTAWQLPTTFKRGALVALFSYLILVGIALMVGVIIFIVTELA